MRYEGFKKEFGDRLAEADAQRRSAPRVRRAQFAGMATALGVAALVVATTHSTSKPISKVSSATGVAPFVENDLGTAPDSPDIYEDFKDSSGQYVSTAGPIRLDLGTGPQERESHDAPRLSPSMK